MRLFGKQDETTRRVTSCLYIHSAVVRLNGQMVTKVLRGQIENHFNTTEKV